ncbi:hypothetical protein LCGC14_2635000 [marine sediment metagenome]|uniref:Uncharacterized protein n=1 Tax=marine sediment metagenome TaxID=412755 RepID=A0A0F9CA19_9ZZZZ
MTDRPTDMPIITSRQLEETRTQVGNTENGIPVFLYCGLPWHLQEREMIVSRAVHEVVRYHVNERAEIGVFAIMPDAEYASMAGRPVVSYSIIDIEAGVKLEEGAIAEIVLYPNDYPITIEYAMPQCSYDDLANENDSSIQIQLCMTPAQASKMGRALSAYAAAWEGTCTEEEAVARIQGETDD